MKLINLCKYASDSSDRDCRTSYLINNVLLVFNIISSQFNLNGDQNPITISSVYKNHIVKFISQH